MNSEELAKKMAERIVAMKPGSSETLARIAHEVSGVDSPEEEYDLFDLEDDVVSLLDERDIMLDRSAYWGMVVGLPYNIPFEVRPIVNGKRGPVEVDEVERLLFSADRYIPMENVDLLLARDESGALVKAIQGFFGFQQDEVLEALVSSSEQKALQVAFRECGVESWYREYPHGPQDILVNDGDSWEMTICLSDGTCIASSGSNDYPEGFDALTSAMMELGSPDFWSQQ